MPRRKIKENIKENTNISLKKYTLRPKTLKIENDNLKEEKRFRMNFSEFQIELLENEFKTGHYPDQIMRKEIARHVGISVDRITVWFQNRRAKHRKDLKERSNGQDLKEHFKELSQSIASGKNLP